MVPGNRSFIAPFQPLWLKNVCLSVLAFVLLFPLASLNAQEERIVEFSADVERYDAGSNDPVSRGRMYVGRHGIRTETIKNRERVVMIFRPRMNSVWMLFPAKRQFIRQSVVNLNRPPLPFENNSPCKMQPTIYQCRMLGTKSISGRETQHWQISRRNQGGKIRQAYMWVDPLLKVAIREQNHEGAVMIMKNIREEQHAPALFSLPKGYSQIHKNPSNHSKK